MRGPWGEEDMCTRGSDLPPRSMAHSLKVIHINTAVATVKVKPPSLTS